MDHRSASDIERLKPSRLRRGQVWRDTRSSTGGTEREHGLRFRRGSRRRRREFWNDAGSISRSGDRAARAGVVHRSTRQVERVEGVRFVELVAGLPGPAAGGEQALAEVLRLARELPDE